MDLNIRLTDGALRDSDQSLEKGIPDSERMQADSVAHCLQLQYSSFASRFVSRALEKGAKTVQTGSFQKFRFERKSLDVEVLALDT
ncbi:MAG: hypothetical protein ABSA83_11030 [Verrucomicrobiota bacterium]|jgi:hypothetical protein